MAHIEQTSYCKKVKQLLPTYFENKSILDVGSLDINGNNRFLFDNCVYLGIDVGEGDNVDLVCKGHEFKIHDINGNILQFDTIISTECFEHDMYWRETLNNIVNNLLKNDGLFVFTCATTGRPEHGTKRMNEGCSPLTCAYEEWENYYKNLTEDDIRSAIDMSVFSSFEFSVNSYSQDLYFWGVKNK